MCSHSWPVAGPIHYDRCLLDCSFTLSSYLYCSISCSNSLGNKATWHADGRRPVASRLLAPSNLLCKTALWSPGRSGLGLLQGQALPAAFRDFQVDLQSGLGAGNVMEVTAWRVPAKLPRRHLASPLQLLEASVEGDVIGIAVVIAVRAGNVAGRWGLTGASVFQAARYNLEHVPSAARSSR